MFYSQTSHRDVAFVKGQCPVCNVVATLKFFKVESAGLAYIIPWWNTKHYVTCGNCFNTFKISKEQMQRIEQIKRESNNKISEGNRCSTCASPYTLGQRFCGVCGSIILAEAVKESHQKSKSGEIALAVIIAIIFLICGVLLFRGT